MRALFHGRRVAHMWSEYRVLFSNNRYRTTGTHYPTPPLPGTGNGAWRITMATPAPSRSASLEVDQVGAGQGLAATAGRAPLPPAGATADLAANAGRAPLPPGDATAGRAAIAGRAPPSVAVGATAGLCVATAYRAVWLPSPAASIKFKRIIFIRSTVSSLKSHPFSRAHASTWWCPSTAARAVVYLSHGHPFWRSHCRQGRSPANAAAAQHEPSQGYLRWRAHLSTCRWPPVAAARQISAGARCFSLRMGFKRSSPSCSQWQTSSAPTRAAHTTQSIVGVRSPQARDQANRVTDVTHDDSGVKNLDNCGCGDSALKCNSCNAQRTREHVSAAAKASFALQHIGNRRSTSASVTNPSSPSIGWAGWRRSPAPHAATRAKFRGPVCHSLMKFVSAVSVPPQ